MEDGRSLFIRSVLQNKPKWHDVFVRDRGSHWAIHYLRMIVVFWVCIHTLSAMADWSQPTTPPPPPLELRRNSLRSMNTNAVQIHTGQAEKFAWPRWESNLRPLDILVQCSNETKSVRVGDISKLSLVPSISTYSDDTFCVCWCYVHSWIWCLCTVLFRVCIHTGKARFQPWTGKLLSLFGMDAH
jgi:hypothetical protein